MLCINWGLWLMTETKVSLKTAEKALSDREGKYLTFALANEEYGLEILKVREIIGYIDVTAIPLDALLYQRGCQPERASRSCG